VVLLAARIRAKGVGRVRGLLQEALLGFAQHLLLLKKTNAKRKQTRAQRRKRRRIRQEKNIFKE
jgi:hypothetical protein